MITGVKIARGAHVEQARSEGAGHTPKSWR